MYPHIIHLHGPWTCEPLAQTVLRAGDRIEEMAGPVPPPCTMTIPCRWTEGGLGKFNGRVRFRRRFSWPSGLADYERLWLVFAGVDYYATVWLNDQLLGHHQGADDPFEFNITPLVQTKNQLVVEVEAPDGCLGGGGGIWGDVTLQVRHLAFLRDLAVHAVAEGGMPKLTITAHIEDVVERQLELYVLLDGHTVRYCPVPSRRDLQLVLDQLEIEPSQPDPHVLQIELIDVSTKVDCRTYRVNFNNGACTSG